MAAERSTDGLPAGFVRLVASERLRSTPGRVAAMLAADPPWADLRPEASEAVGLRRYATDLRLPLGGEGGAALFSKAAYVDFGIPERTADGWRVEVGWRAASAAPLFPVFSGWLLIAPDGMRIEGLYAPPGGVIGRIADRMLLRVAATGTARWLLREIDRAALSSPDADGDRPSHAG